MKTYKIFFIHFLFVFMIGCSKNKSESMSIPNDHGAASALKNITFFDDARTLKPYTVSSPYAEAMSECVYADDEEESCSLAKLPLLGISKNKITVNDILNRTMISHQFLGEAFKQTLMRMDPEILQMFGAVNSIVIADNINPSFFSMTSGAIYLSGLYFWRNSEEFEIVKKKKDIRAEYGSSLQFGSYDNYTRNSRSIGYRAQKNVQTYAEIFFPLVKLLFHELTHANDFFPKSFYQNIEPQDLKLTYRQIGYARYEESKLISQNQPSHLTSVKLLHLGEVLFHGESETVEDGLLKASDIAEEFEKEIATDFYSFSTTLDDLAMNAEESLMLYYFNFYKIVVIHESLSSNVKTPEDYDYPIVWGQKGRVLIPEIKERALYAVENIVGHEVREKMENKFKNESAIKMPANTLWNGIYNF